MPSDLQRVQRIASKYSPMVASLFGLGERPVGIGIRPLEGGRAGEATPGNIFFDPTWLQSASRPDLRGAIIHELTHAYGVKAGRRNAEPMADYARYVLNPKEADYWTPSAEVLRIAERRGDEVARYRGTKGPETGNTNRARDTLINNASKAPLPVVSPGSAIAAGDANAANVAALYARLAQLRGEAGLIKGQAIAGRAQVRSDAIAGMASAVNSALERGGVGSSVDLSGRAGVLAEKASGLASVAAERTAGLLGLRSSRLSAFNDFYSQQFSIEAQKRAEQMELVTANFLNDLVLRLGDESSPQADAILAALEELMSGGGGERPGGGGGTSTGPGQPSLAHILARKG